VQSVGNVMSYAQVSFATCAGHMPGNIIHLVKSKMSRFTGHVARFWRQDART